MIRIAPRRLAPVGGLNSVRGQQFLKEYGQPVFIIPADYSFCTFQEFGTSISHRDAQTSVFDHGYIVDFVTNGDDFLGPDVMSLGDMQNSLPFVDGGIEDFDDADFSAAEAMAENSFSENALQFRVDGLRYIGERDDADANRMRVRMAGKIRLLVLRTLPVRFSH